MDTIDCIRSRRSARAFEPREISEATLQEILAVSTRAPTAGNLQNYAIIVTKEQKRRRDLYEIHFRQEFLLQAPVILTICADVSRNSRWMELRGEKSGLENFWGFLVGMADAWSVAENIALAAHAKGLGTCHSGGVFEKVLNLIDFFECPAGVIPVATMAIGYPIDTLSAAGSARSRLEPYFVTHDERYRAPNAAALTQAYADKERDDLAFYGASGLSVGTQSLAAVYSKLKYPKADMDHFSENYLTALCKQGFISHRS